MTSKEIKAAKCKTEYRNNRAVYLNKRNCHKCHHRAAEVVIHVRKPANMEEVLDEKLWQGYCYDCWADKLSEMERNRKRPDQPPQPPRAGPDAQVSK